MRLIEALATTESLAEIFSDKSALQAMLDFEAALAQAEARCGVIPQSASAAISKAARSERFDAAQIAAQGQRAGTLAIPLVKELTARVRDVDPDSAGFVHWGATSQDVTDTAIALLLSRAHEVLSADHSRVLSGLRRLSDKHAGTVMLGRTLLQAAPPVTFGLKAAGWYAALSRSWMRLDEAFQDAATVQLGGASGTLAALGDHGPAVMQALAGELKLQCPEAPWHAHRERLAQLVCCCGVYAASLGKMARDIALLMQNEVAEACEPGGAGRGGSSTMPNKRNPTACSLALASAHRIPGLVAGFLIAVVQEHERGLGGLQAEWATIVEVVGATGLALDSMAEVAGGLEIDAGRMRRNIESTNGTVFAERAMMMLAGSMGRDAAHKLIEDAARRAAEKRCRLAEILAQMPDVGAVLTTEQIQSMEAPEAYLGSAEIFRRQLLEP
jgi:3-carboxy-cis,cis-muconate cycloisomerase